LRLDATQQIFDRSEDHILAAVVRQVRSAGRGRTTFVVGENEPQQAKLVRPAERGGYGLDALWNDDFHHSAAVALTGRHEAYYSDYRGEPRELVAAAKHGFLYQGQRYQWQRKPRGTPTLDLPAECFVVFLQNHDQIANSGTGERSHALTSTARLRAMTAYLLLMPGIPMLFQGQEFAASTPFFYFADPGKELSRDVREGRRSFLAQFPSLATGRMQDKLPDPRDTATFADRYWISASGGGMPRFTRCIATFWRCGGRTRCSHGGPARSTARSLRTKLGCCGFSRRAMATVY
jgi:maltooligosyltrehalose trehalohydrolase